jgi:hypothetical protein
MRDQELDDLIDAALRQAPEVRVPRHFANRLMARVPGVPAAQRESPWVFPALTVAGTAILGSLVWAAFALDLGRWFMQPTVLAAVLGVEGGVSLAWIWRVFRSAR